MKKINLQWKKINLKWKVSREFPWVISIVILLVASAIFYVLKEEAKRQKIFTQEELVKAIGITDNVATKLVDTIKAKKVVEEELETKKEEIVLTLDRLEGEINARRKAEAQLLIAIRKNISLETELKRFAAEAQEPVELEKIIVKPVPEFVGKVLATDGEHGFIVVNFGSDNLKIGDFLSIYRDDEFIGRAQVERVTEKVSAAVLLPDWKNIEFEENDVVKIWE